MLNENDARELAVHLKAIAGAISAIDIKVLRAVDEIRVAMQDIGIRATTIGEIMEQAAAECPDEPVSPAKAAAQHADEQYRGRASVLDGLNRSPPGHDEFKARAVKLCKGMLEHIAYLKENDALMNPFEFEREIKAVLELGVKSPRSDDDDDRLSAASLAR